MVTISTQSEHEFTEESTYFSHIFLRFSRIKDLQIFQSGAMLSECIAVLKLWQNVVSTCISEYLAILSKSRDVGSSYIVKQIA